MSIKAIFYSKFDPHEGPVVVHQVPEDSILSSDNDPSLSLTPQPFSVAASEPQPLLSFATISRFIIPRQSLCGNLISLCPPPPTPHSPPCLVLCFPICLSSSHYPRNEFIFNFGLVLEASPETDVPAYKSVVRKFAQLMRSLEAQSYFLSSDRSSPNTGRIHSLCETLMEDLNNYRECMIPLDDLNTLNIKIFPTLPNPPPVKAHHVPLLTVRIGTLMDENWDLTLQRIIPHINGVHSVKMIAASADADLKLTKKAIKHLLYYNCLLLLDIFAFNAIYAPTSEFGDTVVKDSAMQRECARYVNLAFAPGAHTNQSRMRGTVTSASNGAGDTFAVQDIPQSSRDQSSNHAVPTSTVSSSFPSSLSIAPTLDLTDMSPQIWPLTAHNKPLDGPTVVQLYANMRQGLTVRDWWTLNADLLENVDLRRFVTFGVIKGFLYRVHRYPMSTGHRREDTTVQEKTNGMHRHGNSHVTNWDQGRSRLRETPAPTTTSPSSSSWAQKLRPYLDGTHCFDEICTELECSERDLMARLEDYPEVVVVICR